MQEKFSINYFLNKFILKKNESHCILASETEYSKTDASVGEYWVRVRANTLAGHGLWTDWVNFVIVNIIKNPGEKGMTIVYVVIIGY